MTDQKITDMITIILRVQNHKTMIKRMLFIGYHTARIKIIYTLTRYNK